MSCQGETVQVMFVVEELPNDMKMLVFLGGELSNSATYCSTFADVNKHNISFCNGTYDSLASDMRKPWKYSKRIKVGNAVEKCKRKLNPKLAESTNRRQITLSHL